ncbi:hypothetical protein N1851_005328 [Merluccius polli]|uniref:Uncharacterized protein n=1 Tax=Merluccius polli TaxID=89951 RepID=A0AA47N792_MERPO|nr:hypothetical protein N1851_005328 [Merluccius polli]
MVRFKKGQRKRATDLWQKAGGRDAVLRSFIDHRFKVNVTSEQWSSISLALANTTKGKYHKCLKWLRVIWDEDRRGVRTEVLHAVRVVQFAMKSRSFVRSFVQSCFR